MTQVKIKEIKLEKIVFIIVGIYVLLVSLITASHAIDMWPFIFFIAVSLFSIYALYKILFRSNTRKLLRIALTAEALFATLLLYPTLLALFADFIGIGCSNWSGVPEKCVDSISFLSIESVFIVMIPMVFLATFSYLKTK